MQRNRISDLAMPLAVPRHGSTTELETRTDDGSGPVLGFKSPVCVMMREFTCGFRWTCFNQERRSLYIIEHHVARHWILALFTQDTNISTNHKVHYHKT
jgi:hypothetical protein